MKPFNLEEALAGKPVKLRDGHKAFVKYQIEDKYLKEIEGGAEEYKLSGFIVDKNETLLHTACWGIWGEYIDRITKHYFDIVGMWEEQQPRITLNLPAPLKEPREGMCFIQWGGIYKSDWVENTSLGPSQETMLKDGRYFANEQDAQEWLNAMKNNRA